MSKKKKHNNNSAVSGNANKASLQKETDGNNAKPEEAVISAESEEVNEKAAEADSKAEEYDIKAEEADAKTEEYDKKAEEADAKAEEYDKKAEEAEKSEEKPAEITEKKAAAEKPEKPKKKELTPEMAAAKAEKKKFTLRKLKYGGAATAVTVIVIVLVVLVNVIMSVLSNRMNMSIDITPDGTFEISQESIDYLNTVNEPVEIVCMTDEEEFSTSVYIYFKQAYEVLKKYTIYSDNITLKFVDMTKDPTYANRYNELYSGDIDQYSIVVSSDKRIKVIAVQDLFNTEINYYTYSQQIVSSNAEQELTSAIMYVTDPDPMNAVVFNSETGGLSYDNVMSMLRSNGYNVSEINPLIDTIPEDTDIVCINAPLNDYSEETVQKIYDFLDNNGRLGRTLIYIADTSQKPTSNINALLEEWGVRIDEGVVGDSNYNNTSSASNYIIGTFIDTDNNEYAANVSDPSLPVLNYYSRPITLLFEENSNRITKSLTQTEETGFVLTDEMQAALEAGEDYEPEFGAYTTMAAARKYVFDDNNNTVYSNILVVGSSIMLSDTLTSATYYNNGDYFISALNSLTGKTTGISIVAKDLTSQTFDMDQKTYSTCYGVFVLVIPLVVVLIGVSVYLRRRHK